MSMRNGWIAGSAGIVFSLLQGYDPRGIAGNPWEFCQRSGVLNMRITKSRLALWPGLGTRLLALLAGLALAPSLVAATGSTAAAGVTAAQDRTGVGRPVVLTPTVQWGACSHGIPAPFQCATAPV